MYLLRIEECFDAAHFLKGYDGKCKNIHGHRWKVLAEIYSAELDEEGQCRDMVDDFSSVKRGLGSLTEPMDHALIIEEGSLRESTLTALYDEGFRVIIFPWRPTSERMSYYFYKGLKDMGYNVRKVSVYETPSNCAIYSEENGQDVD